MTGPEDYDLIVTGGGPGGYVAALEGAHRGLRTALVERDRLGGTCLNWGCIPTKAMLESARRKLDLAEAAAFGLVASPVTVDFAALMARKDRVVDGLVQGINGLMKAAGIRVISGSARRLVPAAPGLTGLSVVVPGGSELELNARAVILATGSRPAMPSIEGIDLPGVITSNEAVTLDRLPESMAVIGGGVIGIELAGVYAALGTKVRVIEALPRILPGSDEELARRLGALLRRRGIEIVTGAKVEHLSPARGRRETGWIEVAYSTGAAAMTGAGPAGTGTAGAGTSETFTAEKVLVAVGRQPEFGGFDLAGAGISHSPSGIKVDANGRTSRPGIWAVGDVTGGPQLAHVASAQGIAAVGDIMGRPDPVDYCAVPACAFSFPELAGVGLNEAQAREQGIEIKVGKFSFAANGRAQTAGEGEGVVKVVAQAGGPSPGKILGLHILGPHASELIHEGVLAIRAGMTAEQLEKAIHLHPSLSEAVPEAARGVYGTPLHQNRGRG